MRVFGFTLIMGAMVGIIERSGGMNGLPVGIRSSLGQTGGVVSWQLGCWVCWYFSTTMRTRSCWATRCNRFFVASTHQSRKIGLSGRLHGRTRCGLGVDWMTGEIDFVQSGLDAVQLTGEPLSARSTLMAHLPYRFYPLWTLAFVFLVAWTARDFGPMYRAAPGASRPHPRQHVFRSTLAKASLTGAGPASGDMASHSVQLVAATEPDGRQLTTGWWNAVIPIFVTVAAVLILLYETGSMPRRPPTTDAILDGHLR